MSFALARIGRVADQGQPIKPGSVANLAIWDPSVETTVSGEALASRSGNTPYAGYTLPGAVRHVLFLGRPSVVDGGLA
jgi:Dihydroorotase and related cyclic amidohydrolases